MAVTRSGATNTCTDETVTQPRLSLRVLILRLFLPFALGYFLSYLYRIINAVIAPMLQQEVAMTAGELGMVSAVYFLCFAAFQIPLGILLDRYEPRKVAAGLLLFAVAGALVFAGSESVGGLLLGRGLIGLGVSACLMAAFKAYVIWFSPRRLPLVNGLQLASGGLGALMATSPVEALLNYTDWRGLFVGLGVLTLLASLLVFTLVPSSARQRDGASLLQQLKGTWQVFVSPAFYYRAPASVLLSSSFTALQGLWIGLWLKDIEGQSSVLLANSLFWLAAGMVAGYILLGWLSERLQGLGFAPSSVCLTGMGLFLLTEVLIFALPDSTPLLLWICFGFFGTSATLMFAVMAQQFPARLSGRVSTTLNLLIFLGAFALQWGIGLLIGLWSETPAGGYPLQAYQFALLVCALLQGLSLLWYLWGMRRMKLLSTGE